MIYRSDTCYPYDCTAKLREIVHAFAIRTCGLSARQQVLPMVGSKFGVVVYCGIVKEQVRTSYSSRVVVFDLSKMMDTNPRDRIPAWGHVMFVGDTNSYQGGRLRCVKMWDYPGRQVAFADSDIERCSRCSHKRPIMSVGVQVGQRCVKTGRQYLWKGDHWRALMWLGLPMARGKPCPHYNRKHWERCKSLLRRAGVPQVCRFCRADLTEWLEHDKTAHHIIAVAHGGQDVLENLDWACWPCHEEFTAKQFRKDDGEVPF